VNVVAEPPGGEKMTTIAEVASEFPNLPWTLLSYGIGAIFATRLAKLNKDNESAANNERTERRCTPARQKEMK
jgi:hypothetical protein